MRAVHNLVCSVFHCGSILSCVLALFVSCSLSSTDPVTQGDEDEGTGTEIVGVVYAPDSTRAQGVTVHVIDINRQPGTTGGYLDTFTTNSSGEYVLDSLPTNDYALTYSGADGVAYRGLLQVSYGADGPLGISDTLHDTLDAPGSLSGVIGLQPGDDPRKVQVLVLGTHFSAQPESTGTFSLVNMARGSYRVRFLPVLADYNVKDTVLSIEAGVDAFLDDTVWLEYTGIVPVTGLTHAYDTNLQIVTLNWTASSDGQVSGYNVYRSDSNSSWTTTPLNAVPLIQTTYRDSFARQDRKYVYRVRAVDTTGEVADAWAQTDTVTIITSWKLVRTIGSMGTGAGELSVPVGLVVVGDKIFVAEQGAKRIQVFDTLGNSLRIFGNSGAEALIEPLEIAEHGGKLYVGDGEGRIRVYDTSGTHEKTIEIPGYWVIDLGVLSPDSIYVLDDISAQVGLVDSSGAMLGEPYSLAGVGTKIGVTDNGVWVANRANSQIGVLTLTLDFAETVTIPPMVADSGRPQTVYALCVQGTRAAVCQKSRSSVLLIIDSDSGHMTSRNQLDFGHMGNTIPVDLVLEWPKLLVLTLADGILCFNLSDAEN